MWKIIYFIFKNYLMNYITIKILMINYLMN